MWPIKGEDIRYQLTMAAFVFTGLFFLARVFFSGDGVGSYNWRLILACSLIFIAWVLQKIDAGHFDWDEKFIAGCTVPLLVLGLLVAIIVKCT